MADDFITLWSPEGPAFSRADFVDAEELDGAVSIAPDRGFKPFFSGRVALGEDAPMPADPAEPVEQAFVEEDDPAVDLESLVLAAREQGAMEVRQELGARIETLEAEVEQLNETNASLASLDEALHEYRARARQQALDDVVQLALAMTRRIVGESMAIHPDALPGVVLRVLEQLPGEEEIVVKVMPEDAAAIETRLRGRRGVRVTVDSEIEAGCLVEATFGTIDATLDTAMAGLESAIRDWREDVR